MIDVTYTQQEMALLVEAAEHFRDRSHLYSGSYFQGVDMPRFAAACSRLLDAYQRASEADTPEPERPSQERDWARVRKIGDSFHLQAGHGLLELTDAGIISLRDNETDPHRRELMRSVSDKAWRAEYPSRDKRAFDI